MRIRKLALALAVVAPIALVPGIAGAQDWPVKPVRAIIAFTPGSATDIAGRIVAEKLGTALGHPVVAENRVGAGGTIGAAAVAKAQPDGYTLLAHGGAHTIAPALYKNLTYHPARDFAAVALVGISPGVLVVPPASRMSDFSPRAWMERSMPDDLAARLDDARNTLSALLDEERRLARLGFELPLARCHEQVRYWGFVTRLLSLPATPEPPRGFSWPSAPR